MISSSDLLYIPFRSYAIADLAICSLGFASFAGFITESTPYFVFFSALFSCVLFGIRVFFAVRDIVKKLDNSNSEDDFSPKDLQ